MPRIKKETTFPMSPEGLFELHSRPEALRRLSPDFPPIQSIEQSGDFEKGTAVRIRIGLGPLAVTWHAELEEVVEGRRFVDVQKAGPFRSWRHVHSFLRAPGGCTMRDEVIWHSRVLPEWLDRILVGPILEHYFRLRHEALRLWVSDEHNKDSRTESGGEREAS